MKSQSWNPFRNGLIVNLLEGKIFVVQSEIAEVVEIAVIDEIALAAEIAEVAETAAETFEQVEIAGIAVVES